MKTFLYSSLKCCQINSYLDRPLMRSHDGVSKYELWSFTMKLLINVLYINHPTQSVSLPSAMINFDSPQKLLFELDCMGTNIDFKPAHFRKIPIFQSILRFYEIWPKLV